MKIRNGFVSNSSSSNFIIIGVRRKDDCDCGSVSHNSDELEILAIDSDEYDYVEGIVIDDAEYLDEKSISLNELQEMAKKVSTILEIDISQVELVIGTRSC